MKNRTTSDNTARKPIRLPMERRTGDAEQWLRAIVHRLVERRAQEIFFEQNSVPNRDLENWLKAEAEMRRFLDDVEDSLKSAMEAGVARNRSRN